MNRSKRDGHIWETLEEQTDPRSVPLLPRVGYLGVLQIDSTTLTNNAFALGKRSLPLTLSPTESLNSSSFSTRIGRVGFSSTSGLSSHGDTEQSNQDRSEHRFLSMRQFATVFTYLTSVDVNLLKCRITITAASHRMCTHSNRQRSCTHGRGNSHWLTSQATRCLATFVPSLLQVVPIFCSATMMRLCFLAIA